MGRRTSVYLPDELAALADASGLTRAALIARGLACTCHTPGTGAPSPAKPRPKRVPQPRPAARGDACPHPKARVMRGLCRACGTYVG